MGDFIVRLGSEWGLAIEDAVLCFMSYFAATGSSDPCLLWTGPNKRNMHNVELSYKGKFQVVRGRVIERSVRRQKQARAYIQPTATYRYYRPRFNWDLYYDMECSIEFSRRSSKKRYGRKVKQSIFPLVFEIFDLKAPYILLSRMKRFEWSFDDNFLTGY